MASEASQNQTGSHIIKKNTSSGILKFVNQQSSKAKIQGKKCNPFRQFGISSDAPIQFRTKNCLIADMANFKQQKAKLSANPEFYSQKNFFTIGHSSNKIAKQDKTFINQYNESFSNNKVAFRRNSSKISKFYEKNAWMGDRFFVMGHQRSEKALQLTKVDVEINNRSAKSLHLSRKRTNTAMTSARTLRFFPTHQDMKETFMSQKNKIRQMRNMLAKPQYEGEDEAKRPYTSLSVSRSEHPRMKISSVGKNSRQFQINLPEWGEKQFNMRFLDWDPERKNGKISDTIANENRSELLKASSKVASRLFFPN